MRCADCNSYAEDLSAQMAQTKYGRPLCSKCYVKAGTGTIFECASCEHPVLGADPICEQGIRHYGKILCHLCYIKPTHLRGDLISKHAKPEPEPLSMVMQEMDDGTSVGQCQTCFQPAKKLFSYSHDGPWLCSSCMNAPDFEASMVRLAELHDRQILSEEQYVASVLTLTNRMREERARA